MATHRVLHASRPSGHVVDHAIVLEAVGSTFVRPLPRSHLPGPVLLDQGLELGLGLEVKLLLDRCHGQPNAVFPRARLGGANQPCGKVDHACAGLDLVAVLPPRARAREKRDGKVFFVSSGVRKEKVGVGIQYRHGGRGAVDPPLALSLGHALDPMPSAFMGKIFHASTRQGQTNVGIATGGVGGGIGAGFSAQLVGQAKVGARQLGGEHAGVLPALSGTEFQVFLAHDCLRW